MDHETVRILFALLRSAIGEEKLTQEERDAYSSELLDDLLYISKKHDVVHLLVYGLQQNELIDDGNGVEKYIFNAVYRYEQFRYEYETLCGAFEEARIPFVPLKGAIIRNYYPEPWMRTSCDIDILVRRENLEAAILYLKEKLNYTEKERATHDVSLFSPTGVHVELHFDLVEEGRANNAIGILCDVWNNVSLYEGSKYRYEMSDEFFYFYHIAHMAKHFESGGCGIRPFLDLWILERMENIDRSARDSLLLEGRLLKFADESRGLCQRWFCGKAGDDLMDQMQSFILCGGIYGSVDNRVVLQQSKKHSRLRYIFSRLFISYAKLRRYYPILNKHPWLMPVMQVRRWFMVLKPDVAKMAVREIAVNSSIDRSKVDEMNIFLDNIGLK